MKSGLYGNRGQAVSVFLKCHIPTFSGTYRMQIHGKFVYTAGASAAECHRCFQLSEDEEKNALFHPLFHPLPPQHPALPARL